MQIVDLLRLPVLQGHAEAAVLIQLDIQTHDKVQHVIHLQLHAFPVVFAGPKLQNSTAHFLIQAPFNGTRLWYHPLGQLPFRILYGLPSGFWFG